MAEEFEESDVVFTVNNVEDDDHYCFADSDTDDQLRRTKRKKVEEITKPKSVNIPVKLNLSWCRYVEPRLYEYEEDEEDGEMVPPHLMVRRGLADKMAFSVYSGIGRTLKGRDMSEMRNHVLRMTGFLET